MAFISSSNTSSGKSEVPTVQGAYTDSAQVPTVNTDVAVASLSYDIVILLKSTDHQGVKTEGIESYKKDPKEDEASKNHALVADEEEVPTEYALMAKSRSSLDNESPERDIELKDNKIEYLKNELEEDNIDDKGYWDSGCSRHMTGNISYPSEYEPFNEDMCHLVMKKERLLTASTPIETQKPLVKDAEAADMDVHLYRSMIGSLMYMTASRPDIIFFIIAVQTLGSGISILLAVGTPSTDSGNLYCQWELSPDSGNALCILFLTDVSPKKSSNLFSNDISLPKDNGSGKLDPPLEMILGTLEVIRGTYRLSVRTGVLTAGTSVSTIELEASSNESLVETFVLAVGFEFPLLLGTSLSLLTSYCSCFGALLTGIASSFFAFSFEVAIRASWNQFRRVMNLRGDSFSFTA
nr:hypothetical protein [Tanacetum cinerariifolium]